MCDFGIMIGAHPWDHTLVSIVGGTVTGNSIDGAKQGINASGGGTAAAPVAVYANQIRGNFGSAQFECGTMPTSAFNIAPDSFIDRHGENSPVTANPWIDCP